MAYASGRYGEAVRIADRFFEDVHSSTNILTEDGWKLRLLCAWASRALGNLARARELLERCSIDKPADPIAHCHIEVLRAAIEQAEGEFARTLDRLSPLKGVVGPSAEHDLFGELCLVIGISASRTGDLRAALTQFEDSAAAFRRSENHGGLARTALNESLAWRKLGDYERAKEALGEASTLQARLNQPRFTIAYLINSSVLDFARGEYEPAYERAARARKLSHDVGWVQKEVRALLSMGRAVTALMRVSDAGVALLQARDLSRHHGFAREEALAHEFLGDLARARGDWVAARAEWEKALEIGERIAPRGDVTGEPTRRLSEAALHEALAARAEGDHQSEAARIREALAFARRAFDVNRSCGDRKEEASTLRALGDIALGRGRRVAARRAYEASVAILAEMGARGELALSQQALDALVGLTPDAAVAPSAPAGLAAPQPSTHALATPPSPAIAAATAAPRTPARAKAPAARAARAARGPRAPRTTAPPIIDDDVIIPLIDPAHAPASHIAFTIPEEGWAFVARDPIVLHLVERLSAVAPLDGSVLLLGETGTGKEMLARLVHTASGRAGAFVAANASAFPETLVESELFGHARGAFTGASQDKKGLFEAAHGGTFFLDEIGDLPLPTQAKLLRTLEERAVKRVGSNDTRKIDVRFVAATNVDLRGEIEAGRFRRDLYYRLCAHEFDIPPLRKRGQDALLLARHVLARRAAQCGKAIPGIGPAAARALLAYPWPGNVRELDNEMQRAATLVPAGRPLEPAHLSARIRVAFDAARANSAAAADGLFGDVALLERTRIETALAATGGNQARAGLLLGMSRQALRYKLLKYEIRPRKAR